MSSDSIAWFNFLYLSYSSSSVISFIANFTSLLLFSFGRKKEKESLSMCAAHARKLVLF